jgi:MoaA/NifB/PqqE/SkfB family radical SAM enzyme
LLSTADDWTDTLNVKPLPVNKSGSIVERSERYLDSKLQFVGLELTTRCTFRCTYCAHSSSKWTEQDYPFDKLEQILEEIIALRVPFVGLSGNGESTMLPYWQNFARQLIDAGIKVSIISNFDRSFTDDEILLLSRFEGIAVSVDTVDYELARKIRRKGDINRILLNIARVKAAALGDGPQIGINAVVADKTVFGLVELVKLGMRLGVMVYYFTSVLTLPKNLHDERMERERNMFPLDTLSEADKTRARKTIEEAEQLVTNAGGTVSCSVGLKASVSPESLKTSNSSLIHSSTNVVVDQEPTSPQKRLTRLCLRPWTEVFLRANGDVQPCCYWDSTGDSLESPARDDTRLTLDSPATRAARLSLLSGELLFPCLKCPIIPMGSTDELATQVSSLLGLGADTVTMANATNQRAPVKQCINHDALAHTYSLLKNFGEGRIILGTNDQKAIWEVKLDDKLTKAILLLPPAELVFRIPSGVRGSLLTAATIHPEGWDKPESGGCEFCVRADDRLACVLAMDPAHHPTDRHWHEIKLDIPENPAGYHDITFETKSIGLTTFRWALWRNPTFVWTVLSEEAAEVLP